MKEITEYAIKIRGGYYTMSGLTKDDLGEWLELRVRGGDAVYTRTIVVTKDWREITPPK